MIPLNSATKIERIYLTSHSMRSAELVQCRRTSSPEIQTIATDLSRQDSDLLGPAPTSSVERVKAPTPEASVKLW